MSKPVPPSQIKGGSIYDRLNDPSTFHASHRERFDENGHGKGKSGRDGPATTDLSQITRSEMKGTSVMVGINSNRTEEARLKAEKAPTTTNTSRTKPVAPSQVKGGSIYDRLNDPSTFHASHKERFDENGRGKDKAGRDCIEAKELSQMTKSEMRGTSVMVGTNSNRTEEARLKAEKTSTSVNKPSNQKPIPPSQVKGGSIFDRLNDPSTFHASHRERFDANGRGKGLNGRETGPAVNNLSQMVQRK